MEAKTYEIVKNIRISTKIGVASMGDTVLATDVLRPQQLAGLCHNGKIKQIDSGETKLSNVSAAPSTPSVPVAPKESAPKKSSKKKSSKKPKPEPYLDSE